jgi:hypothetical protein
MDNELSRNKGYNFIPDFNQDQSYALGLLWADGWMSQTKGFRAKHLRIEVLEADFEDFRLPLSLIGNLTEKPRLRKGRTKTITSAYITNKALCEWLFYNDFKQKSTISPTKILSNINEQYHKDFIRGWIDGDGCFYINKKNNCFQFVLAGTYQQDWSEFEKFLLKNDISYKIVQKIQIQNERENKCSIIRITKRKCLLRLKELIYDNANCFLKRKRDKAFEIPKLKR